MATCTTHTERTENLRLEAVCHTCRAQVNAPLKCSGWIVACPSCAHMVKIPEATSVKKALTLPDRKVLNTHLTEKI